MIEWRGSDEWLGSSREGIYGDVSSYEVQSMSSEIDAVLRIYIDGASRGGLESVQKEDGGRRDSTTVLYSDITTNAYNEPAVTNKAVAVEHETFIYGMLAERYIVNVAWQIEVGGEDRAAPVAIEHYTLLFFRGNEWQAYVDQRDLTTVHGDMQERVMNRYDQVQLRAELAAIQRLYDITQQERANIDK